MFGSRLAESIAKSLTCMEFTEELRTAGAATRPLLTSTSSVSVTEVAQYSALPTKTAYVKL